MPKATPKLQEYLDYIAKLQAMKKQIATYECPACHGEIKTQAAPAGDTWDTLSACPHCDDLHFKVTTGATASAVLIAKA